MLTSLSKKLQQREYWPVHALYAPIYAYRMRNSIRAGTMMYLYDTNPGMPPVRFLQFSKWQILSQLDTTYLPKTYIIGPHTPTNEKELDTFIERAGGYPVIIKPDIGERGSNVSLVHTASEIQEHVHNNPTETFLVQEFIDSPLELGIMYYRYPDQEQGHISSITIKEFFSITGDGVSTIRQLVAQDERGRHYQDLFVDLQKEYIDSILPKGEKKQLTYLGNHSKGCQFINGNHLITPELTNIFDTIAKSITGFYYGRFDIKVSSLEDLYAGRNIKILEVNGVQSEPSHIYDPKTSLVKGYKELFKHRCIMYKISKKNRRIFKQTIETDFWSHVYDQLSYTREKYMYDYTYEPITSFEKLIEQLQKNITRQKNTYGSIDLIRAKHIVELYEGDDWQQYVTFHPNHYTRTPVKLPTNIVDFDIYIIGREGNYMSKIHDHAEHGCLMKILQGELIEKRYTRDMSGNFDLSQVTSVPRGVTTYIHDDIGYHAIGNDSPHRAVGVHVYSPAKYKTQYFD